MHVAASVRKGFILGRQLAGFAHALSYLEYFLFLEVSELCKVTGKTCLGNKVTMRDTYARDRAIRRLVIRGWLAEAGRSGVRTYYNVTAEGQRAEVLINELIERCIKS